MGKITALSGAAFAAWPRLFFPAERARKSFCSRILRCAQGLIAAEFTRFLGMRLVLAMLGVLRFDKGQDSIAAGANVPSGKFTNTYSIAPPERFEHSYMIAVSQFGIF